MIGHLDLRPLDRLRLRLTAWYVITFATIILAIGTALFFVVTREIAATLDRSLEGASAAVAHAVMHAPGRLGSHSGTLDSAALVVVRRLEIPDRSLYIFDGAGGLVYPESASTWVRAAAERSIANKGSAAVEASIGHELTLRVHARRFATPAGDTLIAVAAADIEELEDAYAAVLGFFGAAALLALVLTASGGVLLVRKSTAPVAHSYEQMRRFMADAAHELRTPVAVLRAQTDVALERRRSPEAYREALSEIRQVAEGLSDIVNDLLALARAEAGTQPVRREPLYLDDLVLDAVTAARALAEQNGVHIGVSEYEEAPIVGDPLLVRRLLLILLDNAIKYTPSGGRVSASVTGSPDVAVVIADTGIGISPESLPHLFERFYRGTPGSSRTEGAGLGLAIAQWIAEAHTATIGVVSTPGEGTQVTLRFPHAT